jgi:16S rRNA (guanine966-N2)-methyltransferase
VRIVAGVHRGRRLQAPKGTDTRPTTDRVREALFSALASRLGADLGAPRVLDAFAGSGALGLEALSRGAPEVTFVERDRKALAALGANIASLNAGRDTHVLTVDAFSLPSRGLPGAPFALLLLDPPYRIPSAAVAALIEGLAASGALAQGSFVTWEHSSAADVLWPEGFSVVFSKRYSDVAVDIAETGTGAIRS